MWDSPSVEVTTLKQNCEQIVEQFEQDIDAWYHAVDPPPFTVCAIPVTSRDEFVGDGVSQRRSPKRRRLVSGFPDTTRTVIISRTKLIKRCL
jgi:hypothetical protein